MTSGTSAGRPLLNFSPKDDVLAPSRPDQPWLTLRAALRWAGQAIQTTSNLRYYSCGCSPAQSLTRRAGSLVTIQISKGDTTTTTTTSKDMSESSNLSKVVSGSGVTNQHGQS